MSSLQQFREWSISQGQVSNPTTQVVNQYPGQCVSLVQQYLDRVFGIPYAPRGNAKDFVPPTFSRVSGGLLPGDIIRYGKNYGGGYGHIGIIDDDGKFLDQNGTVPLRVGRRDQPFNGIESVWRPTKALQVKTPSDQRRTANGIATVITMALNVRSEPSTSASVVATYKRGDRFTYDSYIIANGFVWLSYIGNSGNRRYVAEGPYDGNRNNIYVTGGIS
jgi:hypothetical protein